MSFSFGANNSPAPAFSFGSTSANTPDFGGGFAFGNSDGGISPALVPDTKRPHFSDSEDDNDDDDNDSNVTIIPWRVDSQKSLSDWNIEISYPGGLSTTYHVHKSSLVVGDAMCDYFERFFRKSDDHGQQFSEYLDCTSRFNFDQQKAADAFPAFLDFLYMANDKYITTENAVAVYFLAEYFGCRRLRRDVRRFFEVNLTSDTLTTIYIDATQFQNQWLLNEITRFCANNVEKFDSEHSIIKVSDVDFWLAVLSQFQDSLNQSESISLLIAAFCVKSYQNLNLHLFKHLTNESKLPKIHYQAAIQLMAVEQTLVTSSNSKATTESTTTSLQERCEAALTDHCLEVDLDKVADLLHWVDSNVLFRLLKLFQNDIGNRRERKVMKVKNIMKVKNQQLTVVLTKTTKQLK